MCNARRFPEKPHYFKPQDKDGLLWAIANAIKASGSNCGLNHIDVSGITDFEDLFFKSTFLNQAKFMTAAESNLSTRIVAIDKSHLELLIRQHQEKYTDACDLNHIDVSRVKDMSNLFAHSFFTGDISQWDVSGVTNMDRMFSGGVFKGDIARWDVSNVRCMKKMFAASHFKSDLSRWNTSSVESMDRMFQTAHFNSPIDGWNVGRCTDFSSMFADSRFNQDISDWDMRRAQQVGYMFYDCPFAHDVSRWDLPLSCRMLHIFSSELSGLSMSVKVQRPADWHAKLHLDNGSLPPPSLLLDAFNELRSIHETLGSSNEERARDLVHMVVAKRQGKGAGPAVGESWAIDDMVG